jgi:hypothetical protein
MNTISKNLRVTNDLIRPLIYAGGLIILYVLLIFFFPVSKSASNYNLTDLQYRIVHVSLAIPGLLAWLAAFAGYGLLQEYAKTIEQTEEGVHFERLTAGAAWLAWSLPISVLAVVMLGGIARVWPGFTTAAVIIEDYVSLLLPLVAFSMIGAATRSMINHAGIRLNLSNARLIMFLFLALGVTYCLFTFRQLNPTGLGSTNNAYHMPVWLIVTTIIVPYLYAWFVGLLAAYEIALYSKQVSGVLYRQALRLLAGGLITVILALICLQYMSAVQLLSGGLVIDYRILLLWLFRIISIGGFVMMAIGAFRLRKIEEV